MHSLDAIDRKILAALQSDGRITMQQLADRVGLSVSPCHRRVKLLEERGVITRYIATVDQKSLGLHVSVFISIKLARQKEEDLNRFAKAISKWDEVLECYLMTGNRDYLLRVVAADLSSYEAFLKNKLTRLDGIASIESSFALSQVKYSIALPVSRLFGQALRARSGGRLEGWPGADQALGDGSPGSAKSCDRLIRSRCAV
jgi:Lrp/AsnC family leucine-responsive transcriptional regulator